MKTACTRTSAGRCAICAILSHLDGPRHTFDGTLPIDLHRQDGWGRIGFTAKMKTSFAMAAFLGCFVSAQAQPTNSFPLWPDGAPGALGKADKDIPTLTPYWPDPAKATGAAIVICPGGGYGGLAGHEGEHYARFLNKSGIAGFVLKYRLGSGGYRHPVMLQDAARAVRLVRDRGGEWKPDPPRLRNMGSSAGGHLASTL